MRKSNLALLNRDSMNLTATVPWWCYDATKDVDTDVFWITGGLGSGKTFGSAVWFLTRCFQNSRSNFSWAVAPTHSKVRDILIPTFHEVLYDFFHMEFGKDYETFITKPPKLVFYKNKHEIHFHSGARPDLMIGTNISHYLITEVGTQKVDVFEKCQARTRCPKAAVRQGLCEGTPEGENWYSERADIQPVVGGMAWDEANRFKRYQLWTQDNWHLPADYVDKLTRTYAYDPARLESYLYGTFKPFTKGTAYWAFHDSQNVVLDVAPDPHLPIILTWDWNRNPLAWVALQRQPMTNKQGEMYFRYVALAESSGKSRGILDACVEFMTRFPRAKFADTPIWLYGDASGFAGSHLSEKNSFNTVLAYLRPRYRAVILKAPISNPDVRDRLERMAALCEYQTYAVASWCRLLINSHHQTELKAGTWDIVKPKEDTWTHYGDAVGYALYELTKGDDLEQPNRETIYGVNKQI